jgi:uncharacterized protein (TIGR00266 family)
MRYNIWGDPMPAVTIGLDRGESIYTQSGGMSWMTDRIDMATNMRGGFMKGLGRILSGESLFMATYTAYENGQEITLASTAPGEIRVFEIRPGQEIIAQKGAFLCATPGVEIRNNVMGFKSGLFGGEGFILQAFTGQGLVFTEMDGSIKEMQLRPGEVIRVDTGNVAAFEGSVGYSAETVKGFKNVLFGGEGLFLTTLTGPGRVWLQTMPVSALAQRIIPFLPHDD